VRQVGKDERRRKEKKGEERKRFKTQNPLLMSL